jgi:hypothetical protein
MIKRIQIKPHSPEWYAFRKDGYGASEIGAVLAQRIARLTDYIYTSPIQVHLSKIGENVTEFSGNVRSKSGQYMEGNIIDMYRYWDHSNPDQMVMYENMDKGAKKNICRRASYYETNGKYPWLFFSPDGKEYVYEDGHLVAKGTLECKNTSSMEANRYPNSVSPSFIAQVCMGLLISELEYARILIWIDGYKLEVVTLYANDPTVIKIQEHIQYYSAISWKCVEEAKKIKLDYGIEYYYLYDPDNMTKIQQEGVGLLQAIEPELVGTPKEAEWVNENIFQTEEFTSMKLTDEQWALLLRYKEKSDEIKAYVDPRKKAVQALQSELKLTLHDFHQADLQVEGEEDIKAFSNKPDKNGTKRFYLNTEIFNIKESADEVFEPKK